MKKNDPEHLARIQKEIVWVCHLFSRVSVLSGDFIGAVYYAHLSLSISITCNFSNFLAQGALYSNVALICWITGDQSAAKVSMKKAQELSVNHEEIAKMVSLDSGALFACMGDWTSAETVTVLTVLIK